MPNPEQRRRNLQLPPRGRRHHPAWAWLLGWLALCSSATAAQKYVFAHYMVCFAAYGESLAGYQQEIREAQAAGLDGFALNVGAWSGPDTYYKRRVQLLYEAAEGLETGFKLFFSIDLSNTNDIIDMVRTYGPRSASLQHQGRIVLSTFGQNDVPARNQPGVDWRNVVLPVLRSQGLECFFVPHFWPDPISELPRLDDGRRLLQKYGSLLDGLFLFGAAGLPGQLARSNAEYVQACREAGKLCMASLTPHYWGMAQNTAGRRYYEFDGGEGLAEQWMSIIAAKPDWVEIVTWNDFNESTYLAPLEDVAAHATHLATPWRHTHKGYGELSKRFIAWFKTGREPALERDVLYFFYRTHKVEAVSSDPKDQPVTRRIGEVRDTLYVTTWLLAPAQMEVHSGGVRATRELSAGLAHLRLPFVPGPQKFTLRRGSEEVLSVQGTEIVTNVSAYNFIPTSGFAYGRLSRPTAPANLRTVAP